jgi:outer membrane immunogenic protein
LIETNYSADGRCDLLADKAPASVASGAGTKPQQLLADSTARGDGQVVIPRASVFRRGVAELSQVLLRHSVNVNLPTGIGGRHHEPEREGRMKKFLLVATAVAAFAGIQSASAADMAFKAPAPPPVYSWTGFYAGVNVGYSWGKAKSLYDDPNFGAFGGGTPVPPSLNPLSQKLDGVIGGGQIGYNLQVDKSWVVGLEADIQGSGERGSAYFSDPYSIGTDCDIFCSTVSGTMKVALDWFGTARARVGILVSPTTLLYGTGGLAFGGIHASGTITDACFSGAPPACTPGSWGFANTTTKLGWTAGAGVEGVVPSTTNWTWKLEYLFIDLGSVSGTGFELSADFGPLPYTWSTRVTDNILRVGLNYHFH